MMRATLRIAGLTLTTAAIAASWWLVYLPFTCNRVIAVVESHSRAALQTTSRIDAVRAARRNLHDLQAVRDGCCADPNYYLLHGANAQLTGQSEAAIADFTQALSLDHRPEIYFNRGLTLLAIGRIDEAVADFSTAARFNPFLLDELDGEIRRRVSERASATRR